LGVRVWCPAGNSHGALAGPVRLDTLDPGVETDGDKMFSVALAQLDTGLHRRHFALGSEREMETSAGRRRFRISSGIEQSGSIGCKRFNSLFAMGWAFFKVFLPFSNLRCALGRHWWRREGRSAE
jgi:hypothetical protein